MPAAKQAHTNESFIFISSLRPVLTPRLTAAASTQLTVTDTNGDVVYSGAGETAAGQNSFTWNGEDNSGNTLPDGVYTLAVTATAADGSAVQTAVASQGQVTEVNFNGSQPELMVGPMALPLSEVAAVDS